jgi:predicted PurR-regulated permease PerM
MLVQMQDIILPIIYATITAILLSPGVNFFIRKKVNPSLSIVIVLVGAILVIAMIVLLLSSPINNLTDAWPQLVAKFTAFFNQTIFWAADYFNISYEKINAGVLKAKSEMINNSGSAIGITITTMSGFFSTLFLTPVYIFMVLFYKNHILRFIHKLFAEKHQEKLTKILHETKYIIQGYLVGLFFEFVIVSVLNTIGLFILGIDYAIMLGIALALLNVIPYLGGIIGVGILMIIALVTKTPIYVLYVFVMYNVIQLIDNNYIVPKIIGEKVKLNALVSLVTVIAGAALWGIPGMFLSIPLTAILKIVFDHTEQLKPWGFLFGNAMEDE